MRHAGNMKPGILVDGGGVIGHMMTGLHPTGIMRRHNMNLRMRHVDEIQVDVIFMFVENVIMPAAFSQPSSPRNPSAAQERPTDDKEVEVLGRRRHVRSGRQAPS